MSMRPRPSSYYDGQVNNPAETHSCGKHKGTTWTGDAMCPLCQRDAERALAGRPKKPWALRDLHNMMLDAAAWMEWEIETIEDFHHFAYEFGACPGSNVFQFVLLDALRHRGVTLEELRVKREQ